MIRTHSSIVSPQTLVCHAYGHTVWLTIERSELGTLSTVNIQEVVSVTGWSKDTSTAYCMKFHSVTDTHGTLTTGAHIQHTGTAPLTIDSRLY